MKPIRFASLLLVTILLIFSSWTSAKTANLANTTPTPTVKSAVSRRANPNYVLLTIDNQTGGVIYIRLKPRVPGNLRAKKEAPRTQEYFLLASNPGKNQFWILPWIYTYSLYSSNCGGEVVNTKFFNHAINLGRYSCDK